MQDAVYVGGLHRVVGPLPYGDGVGLSFRAEQVSLNRPVGLRILSLEGRDAASLARARAAMAAVSKIDATSCLRVLDYGAIDATSWYVASELANGATLAQELSAGTLTPDRALAWAHGAACALADLHTRGLANGGLSSSALVTSRGAGEPTERVRLADAGIASVLGTPSPTEDVVALVALLGELADAVGVAGVGRRLATLADCCVDAEEPSEVAAMLGAVRRAESSVPPPLTDLRASER